MRRRHLALAVLILTGANMVGVRRIAAQAQDATNARLAAAAARGDSTTVRRLADSVLSTSAPPALQAEALYQRGMIAGPRGAGRADLLRLILDHPMATRAGDALYALALSDLESGDRATGIARLARMVRDHSGTANGPDAAVRLGQLLMTDGDLTGGCAALDSALAHLPAESVERRNQVNYTRRPCERLMAEAATTADTLQHADSTTTRASGAGADSSSAARPPTGRGSPARPPARTTRRPAPVPERRWSAQVAAYTNRDDAERVAARLKARGLDARVTSEQPYRVRVGRYANRSEAVALVGRLKADGTNAILVEAERR